MTQILDDIVEEVLDVFIDNGLSFNDGMHVLAKCVAGGLFIIESIPNNDELFFDMFKKAVLEYKATLVMNNVSIHDIDGHA